MPKGVTVPLIVDPRGAIDGLDKVGDKAGGLSNTLKGLGGVAAAGLVVLGAAAVAAVGGLVSATRAAGEYAENVQLAASTTHLSTEAVQELQYASKVTGISFDTMQTSMVKLTKSMGAAASPTSAQAEAFATLGVATTDASGNLRDSTEVYSDVIAALGEVENPAQRDVIAMTLLGKSALDLNGLIDGTAGSLTDLADQAHTAGAVMSDEMLTKLGNVDDAFDGLSAGADAAKNALGLVLMPVLTELGTEGTGLLGRFTTAILDADGDLGKAAPAIGAVVSDAVTLLLEQLPKLLEVGSSIITSILEGVAKQGPTLVAQAVPVIVNFALGLVKMLPLLLDAGIKILVALIQGIATALPQIIPAAVEAIIGLVAALVDNLPMLIDAGIQLLLGLALGLIEALPQLIEQIPKLITGVITALVGAIPQLVMAGVKLFVALITNLPAIILGIIKAIPEIVTGIVGAFTDPKMIGQIAQAGGQLIMGLWNGIKDLGAWLWSKISGFFGGIVAGIEDFFGINSPSTLFAGFGNYMVLGLEKGLTGSNRLDSIMADLSGQVTDGFQGSLAATARAIVTTSASVPASDSQDSGFTADPQLHTLVRNLISAVSEIRPGWIVPEQLAQISQVGNSRRAAIGAT